jgi:branched-chain amino acid aminotransferase
MLVFLNGEFVPAENARIPVDDRGFLLGDGVYDTLVLQNARFHRWAEHWQRLERGAAYLKIPVPLKNPEAEQAARKLILQNNLSSGVLRIALSRGIGTRGYSVGAAKQPTFVMKVYPAIQRGEEPPQWRLVTSTFRVEVNDPLTAVKHSSKVRHTLARIEADEVGANEAILLNTQGRIAEAVSANFFCVRADGVITPPLTEGALPGTTRSAVMEICRSLNIPACEKPVSRDDVKQASGIFLTNTTFQVIEAVELDKQALPRSPVVQKIAQAYRELVNRETASGRD